MTQKIYLYTVLVMLTILSLYSCSKDKDNYEPPNASIYGTLLNRVTNDTVPTANNTNAFGYNYPDGSLNLYQVNYSKTISGVQGTSYNQNGTYLNSAIFSGSYKAIPTGAFYADTAYFNVNGNTRQDFKVAPFLIVTMQVSSVTATSITVAYQAKTNDPAQNVAEAAVWLGPRGVNRYSWLGSNYIPVDNSSYRDDHSGLSADAGFTKVFSNLQPNTTYFIRSGALASGKNPSNYWNYSRVYEVKTQAQ